MTDTEASPLPTASASTAAAVDPPARAPESAMRENPSHESPAHRPHPDRPPRKSLLRAVGGEAFRYLLPLAILAVGVAGFAALGKQEQPARQERPGPTEPLVDAVAVERHDRGLDIQVDGVVVPAREISLSAEVAGRVVHKAPECRAGRYVEEGQVLFRIDPRDYDLEIARLESLLVQSEVEVAELDVELANTRALADLAEQDLKLRRNDLARLESLAARNVATASNVDESKRGELQARNEVAKHRNQIRLIETRRLRLESSQELAKVQLERAVLDRERTEVRAPASGVVISESVERDSYVQKGSALVVIEDTSSVEVRCSLRMVELDWLWRQKPALAERADDRLPNHGDPDDGDANGDPGDGDSNGDGNLVESTPAIAYRIPRTPVTVSYQVGARRYSWRGVLDRYDGLGLNERTRLVPVRVVVDEPREVGIDTQGDPSLAVAGPPALVRGMFVTVRIHARPESAFLRLPEAAVRPGNVVWRIEDGQLRIERVRVADVSGNRVLVPAGGAPLAVGDRVIVSPLAAAADGMPVRERRSE
ncbi:MAG: HlyD family efflux transporter periplasmic adaptor subunit [Planctomycetaceae bacterium]